MTANYLYSAKFRRLSDGAVPPDKYTAKAVGFDLAADEYTYFEKGDYKAVPTGLVIASPPGHYMMITPRSSLFRRHGLFIVNSPGIVDPDYCGDDDEICILMYATKSTGIEQGERVAQALFAPALSNIYWQEVDTMESESRGGFGSTGTHA